jgi:phage baseplate assembly protein gpV
MTARKKTNSIQLVIAIASIAVMVIVGGTMIVASKNVFAQVDGKGLITKLSGKNEVAPKITKASGLLSLSWVEMERQLHTE